jgi:hydroxymethylpyrimidine/phosphomethylpyrimidine kinase
MEESRISTVLTIAGSDPSAGAGIQQDLKTITSLGCYGTTVITALTVQNTKGVQAVMPVPWDIVRQQLDAIFSDIRIDAIKIGQIPDRNVAQAIVEALKTYASQLPVIYDPVMISTSGHRLMAEDAVEYITTHLFPLCTLITPNIPEAHYLDTILHTNLSSLANYPSAHYTQESTLATIHGASAQCRQEECVPTDSASNLSCTPAFLVKGGHSDSPLMTDILYDGKTIRTFTSPRIDSNNLHGTGCTLSSAIASFMATGKDMGEAIALAKEYMTLAIKGGTTISIGHGNGPLYVKTHIND